MITDRNKCNFVTICCWMCLLASSVAIAQGTTIPTASANDEGNAIIPESSTVRNFSPRVDYNNNEWRPVGRGDPLKNDPTYDYSPPALERVRYWAEGSDKDGKQQEKEKESEPAAGSVRKPSNTSRNELLHFGSTGSERLRGSGVSALHVLKNAKGEQPLLQPKYTAIRRSYYAHQLPTHLMPPPMQTVAPPQLLKPATTEYRHSMPSYMTAAPSSSMSSHAKPHYGTASTAPWMHSSSSMAMQQQMMHQQQSHSSHRTPATHDAHQQESVHYFSYTRPEAHAAHSAATSAAYSTNSIRPHQNALKQSAAPRKPWLHELLQKEVIKTAKPTMAATQYQMGTTKPYYESMPAAGISTTHAPISYMSAATPPHSSSTIYIKPPMATTSERPAVTTTRMTTTTTTTQAPNMTPNRLLIPNTSNLVYRPTVAPMELTTDVLFKHYNQPEQPLRGPMYLIIEGHSKVKKYGKNEIDLHQPKIVPVIAKREPVVRIADPNDRHRGTPETFQVKHLHTKTTPIVPATTTTTTTTTTAAPTSSSTPALQASTTTTTTVKPKSSAALSTPALSEPNEMAADEPPSGMQGLLSLLDGLLEDAPTEQQQIYVTTQRTILKPVPLTTTARAPLQQQPQQLQLDARVSNKAHSIASIDDEADVDSESEFNSTTELPPREVRQIFDYDQLPESRLKQLMMESLENVDSAGDAWDAYEDDGDEHDAAETDKTAAQASEAEYEDDSHQFIKRIDKLVDDVEEEDDEDGLADLDLEDYYEESIDLRRTQVKAA